MQKHTEQNTASEANRGFIEELELQRVLPLSRRTLANHRNNGKLPFVRIGRRILYHWPTVEAFLLRQQRGGQ
ncbi:MAG TPA: helix-turn-helix domain-containing protein [Pyrinomonadaceae bacterium]|nr:helix-turn-helix domain-containing protein [Pyrinomonadaceae bacterium]